MISVGDWTGQATRAIEARREWQGGWPFLYAETGGEPEAGGVENRERVAGFGPDGEAHSVSKEPGRWASHGMVHQDTHNADSIIESKFIYYLEQCGLGV